MKHGGCEKTPWKQCGCETCANDVKHGFVDGWGSAPMNTPYGWSCSAPFTLDPSLAVEMNGKHQQIISKWKIRLRYQALPTSASEVQVFASV